MRIVSEKTINALQEMVNESFVMTARMDRAQSVLDAVFACPSTSNLIHQNIAHLYSGYFADEIGDLCLQSYNIPVIYGNVPLMNQEYSSVEEILFELRDYVEEYQAKLNGCYKIAFENNDLHICADLIKIIEHHNIVVRQMIILCDKIEKYNSDMAFDHVIDKFWILGEK